MCCYIPIINIIIKLTKYLDSRSFIPLYYVYYCNEIELVVRTQGSFSIYTSVDDAIGLSVNTLKAQLIFPSKTNFCNLFEFSSIKSTPKLISSTP
jgi:hypothetical protein